jgi:hypothetical protein
MPQAIQTATSCRENSEPMAVGTDGVRLSRSSALTLARHHLRRTPSRRKRSAAPRRGGLEAPSRTDLRHQQHSLRPGGSIGSTAPASASRLDSARDRRALTHLHRPAFGRARCISDLDPGGARIPFVRPSRKPRGLPVRPATGPKGAPLPDRRGFPNRGSDGPVKRHAHDQVAPDRREEPP